MAARFEVDRTFVSRLEGLGAVRKGSSLAVIGFPVKNKEEILDLLAELGVDFSLIMTDDERWRFVQEKSGIELFNEVMSLVARVRTFDVVIFIGSRQRIRWSAALLDKEVVGYRTRGDADQRGPDGGLRAPALADSGCAGKATAWRYRTCKDHSVELQMRSVKTS